MKRISTKIKHISLGSISTIAIAIIPIAIVSCSSNDSNNNSNSSSNNSSNNQSINSFISSFKNNSFNISVIKTYKSQLPSNIPTTLTSTNINEYFNNIPSTPNGMTLNYSTTSNDLDGTITLIVSASESGSATQKSSITFDDFLTSNQWTNQFLSSFRNNDFNISTVKTYESQLPSKIPATLTSTNIGIYFNNIPSTPNGITLIYKTIADDITGTIILKVAISSSNDMSQNASLTLNNFLSVNQSVMINFINSFNNSPSNTNTIISGNSNITASQVPTTAISSTNISQYFTNLPIVTSGSSPITISYNVSNVNNNLGTLDLSVNLSAANALDSNSNFISISGFSSAFQANQQIMNSLSTKLKGLNLNANANKTSQTSSEVYDALKNNNPLSLNTLLTYFNANMVDNILSPISNLSVIYSILPMTSILSSEGKVEFNIRLTLGTGGSIVSEDIPLIVSGFNSTPILDIQTSNLSRLKNLALKLSALPLSALSIQNSKTPTDVFTSLSSQPNLNLTNLGIYFDTSTITTSLETIADVNASYSLIQPTTTNLQNGVINIWITLSLGTGSNTVTIGTALTINGFLNTNHFAINSYIKAIDNNTNIRGNNAILASNLPSSTNLNYYLINLPILPSNQISLNYSFSNLNDIYGSANLVITISAPNVKTIVLKPILISGFLSSNQDHINNYVATINNNSSSIKGTNDILPSQLSNLTIGTYLKGLPINKENFIFNYNIINFNNLAGTVALTITISAINSVAQTSNKIIIGGFQSQSIESLLSSITANDFDTSLALNKNYPVVNGTFLTLPIWLFNKNNSSINIIPGLPFSLIKSYTISDWNSAFGSAYMTILTNSGASVKILLNNIGSGSYYLDNVSKINFSTITSAITPFSLNKVNVSPNLNIVRLFKHLGITILSGNIMYPYITSYQFEIINTNTNNSNILSITLYFTNPLSHEITSKTYTINGSFLPANTNPLNVLYMSLESQSIYSNYWSTINTTPFLSNSATSNSLYIPNPDASKDSYQFKSNATIASSGINLPSFLLGNINWPIGYSDANVTSWSELGDNNTGIATYTIHLKNGDKSATATLQVSGFMTITKAQALANISINKVSNISTIPTPSNGIINSNQSAANFGIAGFNWDYMDISTFEGGIDFYSVVNSNISTGSINWLCHFNNGIILSIPINGYSTNSLANITITPKTNNIVAPNNGQLSLAQAKTYFDFKNINSEIENTFQTIIVSNSNNTGIVNLTITTNQNITITFTIKGFVNISYEVGEIQSLIKFHNNGNSLINIASVFPNGNLFVLTATEILNNKIPNWISIPEKAKDIIKNLISSGVAENTIQLVVTLGYTTFPNPKDNNFSNPVSPLWSVTANGFNSVTYGTDYTGQIFESAQQYLKNSNIFHLSLNQNIFKKQTLNNFIKTLSSPNNDFMGTISPAGNFSGGFQGNTSNLGTTSSLYTTTQWNTITSLFDLNIKQNVFGWNLNQTPTDSNTTWWSMINIVCQQKINGILVRVYFGWNAYIDTLIPNSDFIVPSVEQIIGQNIVEAINNAIPNNQSLDVFKNNQWITFNLGNIPKWINLTEDQVNAILVSTGFNANDINVKIKLPNYVYPPATNSTNSATLAEINISINGIENSTSIGYTSNFAPAITLFQKLVHISLNANLLNKVTFEEFMSQYVIPNNFETRTNNLPVLLQMFDINIIPTWFSQWNIANISQATVIPNLDHTSVIVTIYIQDNIWTTIHIPVGMFATTPLNSKKIMTSQVANSIATNIKLGTSLSNFVNNQSITFSLNNIPSWINNQISIQNLILSGEELSNIMVTIELPQYLYAPDPNNTTNSNTTVQIRVSIVGDALLSDVSFALSNNFETARSYFQSITTLSLKSNYSSLTSDQLWAEISSDVSSPISTVTNLTLIQQFFNIDVNNSIFGQWNLNNITSLKIVNNGASGISVTINMQENIWATFVILANVQSQIANEIAKFVISNTSLTYFSTSNSKAPITFTLNNIPSWITNQNAIKSLIPAGINGNDVNVSFALPSVISSYLNTNNSTSMTSSIITVIFNGISATAITNNFESAQSYLQAITTVTLNSNAKALTFDQFWAKANANGWSNGSKDNSPSQYFNINIPSNNIFGYTASSFNFWVVATKTSNNNILMEFMVAGNVWVNFNCNSNEFS